MGELQSLCRVHRHQHHGVGGGVVLLDIGVKGDLLQKTVQAGVRGMVLLVAHEGGAELADVFEPGPALHVALGLQQRGVPGFFRHRVVELRQGAAVQQTGAVFDHRAEGAELCRGLFQRGIMLCLPQDGVEGQIRAEGQTLGGFQCFRADPPRGIVDDPQQTQIVRAVVDHAQIGQHVLDFGPVEEAGPAEDAVGDAVEFEGAFNGVGLGVRPVEHGKIPVAGGRLHRKDPARHIVCLVIFVHRPFDVYAAAGLIPGPELLALAPAVVGDHGVCRVQNCLRGAVVLLQADQLGVLVLIFKIQDVLDGRAAEAVDALVVVAHHAEIPVPARQQGGQQILQIVRVLILVHQDVAEFPLIEIPHLLVFLQELHGQQDDIVKIQRVGLAQPALVVAVAKVDDPGAGVVAVLRDPVIILRKMHFVLLPADPGQDLARRELLFVDVPVAHHVLHHPLGVRRVVDGEAAGVAQPFDLPAQDPAAGRVEGHGPDLAAPGAEHGGQPLLELVCRLVRKGDRQDVPRRHRPQRAQRGNFRRHRPVLLRGGLQLCQIRLVDPVRDLVGVRRAAEADQIRDPVDQHRCLAASRAG